MVRVDREMCAHVLHTGSERQACLPLLPKPPLTTDLTTEVALSDLVPQASTFSLFATADWTKPCWPKTNETLSADSEPRNRVSRQLVVD